MNQKSVISLTLAMSTALTLAANMAHADEKKSEKEKCFGVSLKGKNDCMAGAGTSCAGSAVRDFQGTTWKYVPKGTCLNTASPTSPTGKGQLAEFKEKS